MTATQRHATQPGLAWVAPILWPEAGPVRPAVRRPEPNDMVVLPSPRQPRLLLPADHRPTARLLLGHGGSGHHPVRLQARRTAATTAAAAVTGGLLPVPTIGTGQRTWLHDRAIEHFPAARAVGFRLGTVRPNRKPVLLAGDDQGRLVGVGKVGWSPLTRGLVERIAERLAAIAPDDALLVAATHGTTREGDVLVQWQEALPIDRARPQVSPEVLHAGLAAVSRLGPTSTRVLADAPYAETLRARAGATARPDVEAAVSALLDRRGDQELAFGTWHGDFSPWNMAEIDGRLALWDWERTADDVPVGMDACHLHLSLRSLREDGAAEAARAAAAADGLLDALEVPAASRTTVAALHRVELLLRLVDHPPAAPVCRVLLQELDR